jgi:hypothetical protein
MKKLFIIFTLLTLTCSTVHGQTPPKTKSIFNDDNFLPEHLRHCKTTSMPLFPGGKESLDKFIAHNLKRPTPSWRGQGKVHIKFKIDSVGHVSNITVLRGLDFLATQEALRVVGLMPTWIPGTCDGKCVDIWYNMPIKFKW